MQKSLSVFRHHLKFATLVGLFMFPRLTLADTFQPHAPTISVFSAQILFHFGAVLVLALVATLCFRRNLGRHFTFSLRWLLAFSMATGLVIGGATRYQLALKQEQDYRASVEMKKRLNNKTVSLEMLDTPLNDALNFMCQFYKVDVTLDPELVHEDVGKLPINLCPVYDVRGNAAFKMIAKSVGLQCECEGNRIALVRRTRAAREADAELEKKLSFNVSIDFEDTPVPEVLKTLSGMTAIDLVWESNDPNGSARTPITLHLHGIEARSAIKWVLLAAEIDMSELNDGDLCEIPSVRKLRDERNAKAIEKKLDACVVSFNYVNQPLDKVIEDLAKKSGVNICLDWRLIAEGTRKTPINLRVTDMPARLALKWVLKLAELEFDIHDEVVWVSKAQTI